MGSTRLPVAPKLLPLTTTATHGYDGAHVWDVYDAAVAVAVAVVHVNANASDASVGVDAVAEGYGANDANDTVDDDGDDDRNASMSGIGAVGGQEGVTHVTAPAMAVAERWNWHCLALMLTVVAATSIKTKTAAATVTTKAAAERKGQRKMTASALSLPPQKMKTPMVEVGEATMTSTIAAVARVAGRPQQQTWVQRDCRTGTTSCDA